MRGNIVPYKNKKHQSRSSDEDYSSHSRNRGFVAISLLLIVISVVSLYNLNSIGSATEEVNDVALPTVAGSNALKASFLNMGRLTFESYIEENLSGLEEKRSAFDRSQNDFEQEYKNLPQQ